MPKDHQWLERRRRLLVTAINYVEDQKKDLSRDTLEFLAWARHELLLVETLLREKALLETFLAYRRVPERLLAAA